MLTTAFSSWVRHHRAYRRPPFLKERSRRRWEAGAEATRATMTSRRGSTVFGAEKADAERAEAADVDAIRGVFSEA